MKKRALTKDQIALLVGLQLGALAKEMGWKVSNIEVDNPKKRVKK